jgi:hypothetical protein
MNIIAAVPTRALETQKERNHTKLTSANHLVHSIAEQVHTPWAPAQHSRKLDPHKREAVATQVHDFHGKVAHERNCESERPAFFDAIELQMQVSHAIVLLQGEAKRACAFITHVVAAQVEPPQVHHLEAACEVCCSCTCTSRACKSCKVVMCLLGMHPTYCALQVPIFFG